MSVELDSFQLQGDRELPNATAVLVLGILSLITCVPYGIIGLILGITALALHRKDKALYLSNPDVYKKSFKKSKVGKICAIISLILTGIALLCLIAFFILLMNTNFSH